MARNSKILGKLIVLLTILSLKSFQGAIFTRLKDTINKLMLWHEDDDACLSLLNDEINSIVDDSPDDYVIEHLNTVLAEEDCRNNSFAELCNEFPYYQHTQIGELIDGRDLLNSACADQLKKYTDNYDCSQVNSSQIMDTLLKIASLHTEMRDNCYPFYENVIRLDKLSKHIDAVQAFNSEDVCYNALKSEIDTEKDAKGYKPEKIDDIFTGDKCDSQHYDTLCESFPTNRQEILDKLENVLKSPACNFTLGFYKTLTCPDQPSTHRIVQRYEHLFELLHHCQTELGTSIELENGLSTGAIVGIVIGTLAGVMLIGGLVFYWYQVEIKTMI